MDLDWYDLNARHVATGLWLMAVAVFFFKRSADVRRSVYDVLTAFNRPAILLPSVGLLVYESVLTCVAVTVGRKEGIWTTFPVVTATVWAITAGFPLLFNLGEFLRGDRGFLSRVVAVLGPSAVVTSIMGIAVQSFWWELILVPILSVMAMVLVYLAFANRGIGLVIVFSIPIWALLADSTLDSTKVIFGLETNAQLLQSLRQSLLLPPVLTVGTLPYLKFIVVVEQLRFERGAICKVVKSIGYGEDWPLTVDSARLCCRDHAVWVEVNRRKYGLNGTADTFLKSYGFPQLDLNEIWRDDPVSRRWVECQGEGMVLKVSIHRLLQDGLALERQG